MSGIELYRSTSSSPKTMNDNGRRIYNPKGCELSWMSVSVYGLEQRHTRIANICWSRKPKKRKEILHKVSGVARPGRLLAIMGGSGAGKTTLLNVLTSRNLSGLDVRGSVTVDNQRMNRWKLKEISAFVQQHDMFIGTMTVREHLLFMASLRMGSAYTVEEQKLRVDDVIRMMGLSDCEKTLIGISNSIKGLSCGERKRLAFASEILTCPKILFCDEPTSGLDAFMAGHVVTALRRLADGGMSVVITIHQPSSQVYSLFNDVCLMAFGRVIYLGPMDGVNPIFESCGYPCPNYFNPADHVIRTIAVISGQRNTCLTKISNIRRAFTRSSYGRELIDLTEKQEKSSLEIEEKGRALFNMNYKAPLWTQLCALTWRCWLTTLRDPMLLKIRFIQTVICAVLIGMVYYDTPITSDTIISINGILFNHVRNLNFMLQFPAVSIPQYIVLPIIYNTIVYLLAGLLFNVSAFLFATIVSVLVTNVAISISYAVATLFGTTTVAMTILPIFVVPMLAFGGFFITYESIPSYFTWLSTLSYFKYGYEGLAINEWECIDVIPGCLNNTSRYLKCFKSGEEVLESIDFNGINKWTNVIILCVMIVVFRLISYIALVVRAFYNR